MGEEKTETIVDVPATDDDVNGGGEEATADSEKRTLRNRGFSFTKAYQMPQRYTKVAILSLFFIIFYFGFELLKTKMYVLYF
jgi:hypothetical protein